MSPEGIAQLARWGLAPAVALAAGLFETENARALYPEMPPDAAIVIPYFDPLSGLLVEFDRGDGLRPFSRLRWLKPVDKEQKGGFAKPKPQRYLQPSHSGIRAYFPPLRGDWPDIMYDVRVPLIITEGEAKGLAGCSNGFATIALGGVYSFADRNGALLPELEAIRWNSRDIYICFDSDAAHNVNVLAAEARLVDELQRKRGARAHLVRLPSNGDDKVGLDDAIRLWGVDEFEKIVMRAQALGALDAKVIALNQRVAWIEREGMIFELDRKIFIKKDNFLNGSHYGSDVHVAMGGKDRKSVKHVSVAATWLKHPHAQRYGEVLFRPGAGPMVHDDSGRPALNLWEGYHGEPGDITPFLELTTFIFSKMRTEDRDLPLKLMAYKAQHPAEKIPLALVFVGPQGAGKSLWGDLVREAFDPYGIVIGASDLTSNFQGWMERSLVAVVDEAAADIMANSTDRLKNLISEANQQMQEKFRPQRQIKSYTFYIINSNRHAIASFEADDRRMVVVKAPKPREKEFYGRVLAWRKAGGCRRLIHWLVNLDLKGWEPPQRAPMSAEKSLAYEESLSAVQTLAVQMRTANEHTIVRWLDAARAWATRAEMGQNAALAQFATTVRQSIDSIQIRPWYTPSELSMLFPAIVEQTMGSKHNRMTPAGAISRELRDAGIPYLESADDPRGFWRGNALCQYLVVADFEEWEHPIKQSDFDRLMLTWPTYAQVKGSKLR